MPWRCFTKLIHAKRPSHVKRINYEMLLTKLLRGRPRRRRRLQWSRERSICARDVLPPCPAAAAFSLFFVASSVEESEEPLPPPLAAIPFAIVATAPRSPLSSPVQERGVSFMAGFSLN